MSKRLYLDNAATTCMKQEVLNEMIPYFTELYGNPSSSYDFSKEAKKAIEKSRKQIAEFLNCKNEEIYFTSGGTESDNWALKGIAEAYSNKGKHIIVSKIEHHAVLHSAEWLEKQGFEITYLDVDCKGLVDLDLLEKSIREDTILISIMAANNEIGTIQPIQKIGSLARKHKVLFHCDAVQAYGHIPIDVAKMKIDMLSASGHKICGPKGIGILYIKKGIKISNIMHGGAQEHGLRPGTYNVPGIVGFGKATENATVDSIAEMEKIRDYFISNITEKIPYCRLNGDSNARLPNNINICFDYVDAESLLVMLNEQGIFASAGSACTTGQVEPSHVLTAIGLTKKEAQSSIRFTLSDDTTIADMDWLIEVLITMISKLRSKSSEYKKKHISV